MYRLTYRNKIDKEEKTLTGTTEENCIEKYRREVAALPQNYEVISIVNNEGTKEEKTYKDGGKIRNKTIKTHSNILKYIKNNYCNGKDFIIISEKVVVNCGYCIQIEPTEEWF